MVRMILEMPYNTSLEQHVFGLPLQGVKKNKKHLTLDSSLHLYTYSQTKKQSI